MTVSVLPTHTSAQAETNRNSSQPLWLESNFHLRFAGRENLAGILDGQFPNTDPGAPDRSGPLSC